MKTYMTNELDNFKFVKVVPIRQILSIRRVTKILSYFWAKIRLVELLRVGVY